MMTPRQVHPALYRAYQFFVALKAGLPAWAGGGRGPLTAQEQALVKAILPTPAQQALFTRMPPNDQRHALAVVRTLRQAGHHHPALMQAALLHDAAKSLGQPIIHRVLIVLFNAFWPAALARLTGQSTKHSAPVTVQSVGRWRRPFVVHAQHPAIGGAWAKEAGCDPLAVQLIIKHQDEPVDTLTEEQKLLAALRWADNLN